MIGSKTKNEELWLDDVNIKINQIFRLLFDYFMLEMNKNPITLRLFCLKLDMS